MYALPDGWARITVCKPPSLSLMDRHRCCLPSVNVLSLCLHVPFSNQHLVTHTHCLSAHQQCAVALYEYLCVLWHVACGVCCLLLFAVACHTALVQGCLAQRYGGGYGGGVRGGGRAGGYGGRGYGGATSCRLSLFHRVSTLLVSNANPKIKIQKGPPYTLTAVFVRLKLLNTCTKRQEPQSPRAHSRS